MYLLSRRWCVSGVTCRLKSCLQGFHADWEGFYPVHEERQCHDLPPLVTDVPWGRRHWWGLHVLCFNELKQQMLSHLNFPSFHRRSICVTVGCYSGWISVWFSLGHTLLGVLQSCQGFFPFGFNSVWEFSLNCSKFEGLISVTSSCLLWVQDMPRLLAFSLSHKIWVWDIFKFIVLIWFSVENKGVIETATHSS